MTRYRICPAPDMEWYVEKEVNGCSDVTDLRIAHWERIDGTFARETQAEKWIDERLKVECLIEDHLSTLPRIYP